MGRRIVIVAAVVLSAVLVVAGVRFASAGEGGDATTLLDRVAAKLGIEPDRLQQAFREARDEEIDERVQEGDLSQEQADRLKERLDDMPPGGGRAPFPDHRGHGPHPWLDKLHGVFGLGLGLLHGAPELSDFFGIDEDDLMRQLVEGDSLAEIAEANGKSRDELKAFIQSQAGAKIDEAVESGLIPPERADELKSNLNEHLDDVIDGELPGFEWRFKFPDRGPFHRDHHEDEPQDSSEPENGSSFRS